MTTINNIEDLIRILDENPEWLEALRVRLLSKELLELPAKFAELSAEVSRFVEATNRRFDRIEDDLRILKDDMRILKGDVGNLKGLFARREVIEDSYLVAREMGLRRTKALTPEDLWDMTDASDTADISAGNLKSFRRADLIMETVDGDGEVRYVAVEISFTVDGRDTTRAIRNAKYLTRFTGQRSHAAVAGIKMDECIRGVIESGEVFWRELDPAILEPE